MIKEIQKDLFKEVNEQLSNKGEFTWMMRTRKTS